LNFLSSIFQHLTSSKTLEDTINDALTPLIDARLHVILGPMVKEELRKIFSNTY
jgi:hypothetical protein